MPVPSGKRAICNAGHTEKATSFSIREIMIMGTQVSVALQTMPGTGITSLDLTNHARNARAAPIVADHPIFSRFGCQMTSTRVKRKISVAITGEVSILYAPRLFE